MLTSGERRGAASRAQQRIGHEPVVDAGEDVVLALHPEPVFQLRLPRTNRTVAASAVGVKLPLAALLVRGVHDPAASRARSSASSSIAGVSCP